MTYKEQQIYFAREWANGRDWERERGEMRARQLIAFIRFLEGPPLLCLELDTWSHWSRGVWETRGSLIKERAWPPTVEGGGTEGESTTVGNMLHVT